MTAVKTVIGALEEARDVLLQRVSGLAALQTQRAIEELVAQIAAVSASAAPKTAEYLVAATDATLTAERVATNTATITWDFATAGQAKANLAITPVVGSLGAVDNTVVRTDGTGGATAQGSLVTIGDTGIMNGATAVGVNATADTTNRLSVNSAAVLFNHVGTGTQIKVNKNATGDTGSYLFQTGFSGRAEFGTIGDNDFTLKTSVDGSAFITALIASNADGALRVGVNLRPTTNNGAALGTATVGWSTAFFGSGGVLNFNNGDVLVTHSSNLLAFTGASNGYNFDSTVSTTGSSVGFVGFSATSTEAAAAAGPILLLDRNSASPADQDTLGQVLFRGRDSGGNATDYVTINARATTVNNGTEASLLFIETMQAGALVATVLLEGGATPALRPSSSTPTAILGNTSVPWANTFTTAIELGNASDTTLARASAGDVNIEGNRIYRAGGTDVPVADGGTGVSSLTAYAVVCGGTTTTNPVQSIASVGTSGHVLTSNGGAAMPTFQVPVGGGLTLLTSGTVSAAATLDIVLTSYAAYRNIRIDLQGIVPATDDTQLFMRTSTDGGASYDAGASDYSYAVFSHSSAGSQPTDQQNSAAQIGISIDDGGAKLSSDAGASANYTVSLPNRTAATKCQVQWAGGHLDTSARVLTEYGTGFRNTAADVDAVRFLMSGGNITLNYAVYGLS